MSKKRQSGRINYILVALVICGAGFVAIVGLFLANQQSPSQVTNQFLTALAYGNVDNLMKLSWYDGDKSQLKQEWEFTTQVAGKHYRFIWDIKSEKQAGDSANVVVDITKNWPDPGAYPDQSAIPLVKKDGQWLVDVVSIDKKIYPDLPN